MVSVGKVVISTVIILSMYCFHTWGWTVQRRFCDIDLLKQFQNAQQNLNSGVNFLIALCTAVKDASSISETPKEGIGRDKVLCCLSLIFYGSQASYCYLTCPDLLLTCVSTQLFFCQPMLVFSPSNVCGFILGQKCGRSGTVLSFQELKTQQGETVQADVVYWITNRQGREIGGRSRKIFLYQAYQNFLTDARNGNCTSYF